MYNTEIWLIEEKSGSEALLDLQSWLKNQQISGLRIERVNCIPDPEKMGITDSVLSLSYASGGALKRIVQSIDAWSKSRNPKVKIKMKDSKSGLEIELNAENLPNLESVVERFLKKIE